MMHGNQTQPTLNGSLQNLKEIMLEILRQKKESWLVKGVLGFIIASFAIFFGSSTLRQASRSGQSPAIVNGDPVPGQKYQYVLDQQMEQLRQIFKNEIPLQFEQSARQNILQSMINSTLLYQDLKSLGLQTTNQELAENIKSSPEFIREGKFDFDFYSNRYLPGYQAMNGTSFEIDRKNMLAIDHLYSTMDELYEPGEAEVKLQQKLNDYKFKFEVVKIPKQKPMLPEAGKEQANTQDKTWNPEDVAKQVIALFNSESKLDAYLKEQGLTKKQTSELSIAKLETVFGGRAQVANAQALLQLSDKSPLTKEALSEENNLFVVKLVSKQEPTLDPASDMYSASADRVQETVSASLKSAYIKSLREKAEIEFNQ